MSTTLEQIDSSSAPEMTSEHAATVDFKMVTFSLAGKDYGVDIMNVKEIAKADTFTFVPNAVPFLRGVYNLRGDIIPVIDLRVFFHLPAEKKGTDALESMLILLVEEQVFGIIVDNIDKVVGINFESIQPPHPIFGDINIKYIRGVVENEDCLYIILDVERIFAQREEEKAKVLTEMPDATYLPLESPSAQRKEEPAVSVADSGVLDFVKESLHALKRFTTSSLNEDWIETRFKEWQTGRSGEDLQVKNIAEADDFLAPFYSPCSGRFWSDDYAEAFMALLPDLPTKTVNLWNAGCGKGYETWSLACILRRRYPDAHIKIWANDNDLLAISNAPSMVFELEDIPEYCREFMVKSKDAYSFDQKIKDSVLFEYHDVLNANPYPNLDFIVSRDLLSFFSESEQIRVFNDFVEKLKSHGILFLGQNERAPSGQGWRSLESNQFSAFMRTK